MKSILLILLLLFINKNIQIKFQRGKIAKIYFRPDLLSIEQMQKCFITLEIFISKMTNFMKPR